MEKRTTIENGWIKIKDGNFGDKDLVDYCNELCYRQCGCDFLPKDLNTPLMECDCPVTLLYKAMTSLALFENLIKKTDMPQPLTVEELRERDGKPVWVVETEKDAYLPGWELVEAACEMTYRAIGPHMRMKHLFLNYGKLWIAFDYPPEVREWLI